MRILHCVPNLTGGGAERQLCLLAHGLAKRGVDVHIAFVPGGVNDALVEDGKLHLHRLEAHSSYDIRLLKQLYSVVVNTKPDIVQTWLPQMDILGGIAARSLNRPFLLTERSSAAAYTPSARTNARFFAGRFATAVVANSYAGLATWRHFNRSPLSTVIRNGIPEEEHSLPGTAPYRNDALEREEELILFVGRFDADKNVMLTVDATIDVLMKRPSSTALFLGQGALRDALRTRVRDARLEDRMVIGPFASNSRFWMTRAKALVSISAYEGHPNAVIEAAMMGAPLVLSDIAAHREVFGDNEAFYVSGTSRSDVSSQLLNAIANTSVANHKAASARQSVAPFTVDAMVSAYVSLYQEIGQRDN